MRIWLALSLIGALLIGGCSSPGKDDSSRRDNKSRRDVSSKVDNDYKLDYHSRIDDNSKLDRNSKREDTSHTELREYDLNNGLHVVVGVGKWNPDRTLFIIRSYDGEIWEMDPGVVIVEKPVTLESFQRVTK